MISDEHQLALLLLEIGRKETLLNKPTKEDFEKYWLREAIKLIKLRKASWIRKYKASTH